MRGAVNVLAPAEAWCTNNKSADFQRIVVIVNRDPAGRPTGNFRLALKEWDDAAVTFEKAETTAHPQFVAAPGYYAGVLRKNGNHKMVKVQKFRAAGLRPSVSAQPGNMATTVDWRSLS